MDEPSIEAPKPSIWRRITPFSKYAAMLLFVVLPFVGGWLGYHHAPEKVLEVERTVVVERDRGVGNDVLWDKDLLYKTSMMKSDEVFRLNTPSRYIIESDMFVLGLIPASANDISEYLNRGDIGLWLERNADGGGSEYFFEIHAGDETFCRLGWCQLPTITDVSLDGAVWNYLGESTYCDVGECSESKNIYKRAFGNNFVYITTLEPLHGEEFVLDDMGKRIYTEKDYLEIPSGFAQHTDQGADRFITSTIDLRVKE